MEVRDRTDNFWKVFSVVLLIVMIGLVGVVVWQGTGNRPAFYESKPAARSTLAALSPALEAGSGNRYWVSDLAEQALPFVVNIQTKVKTPQRQQTVQGDELRERFREFHRMLPFNVPINPDEMQGWEDVPQNMPEEIPMGVGSGFIVREDGYIVTNAHVVDNADEFTVTLADGKELSAKLIGKDDFKDIAVLKVDGKAKLPVAELGDSKATRIGEPVIAIGSPMGFSATVTAGIISANHRASSDLRGLGEGVGDDVRRPQHYLQTDAAINRGNSGGPLINSAGQVIGVNQAIARWDQVSAFERIPIEGIGFAIPIDEVKDSIDQIVKTGDVKYPGISAQIQTLTDYLQMNPELKLQAKEGVYIVRVTLKGPADKAGIKAGDVVVAIDGQKVTEANEFIKIINSHKVGDRVTLRVARGGGQQQEDVSVVLEALDLSKQM